MDKNKSDIAVLEHQIVVSVGNKGDKIRLRILPDGNGCYVAAVTEHKLPNNTECIDVPNFAYTSTDLQTVVHDAVNGHFDKFHHQNMKPCLAIVSKKPPSNK